MGKKIAIGIIAMMCLLFAAGCQTATVDKTAEDYKKIETLTKAVDEVAFSRETYSMDRRKIYAGGYEDENMLYPTWNYTKLPFSDAVSFDGLAAETIK